MPDKMDEMVLVVDTQLVMDLGYFSGLHFDRCEPLLKSMDENNCRFMRRGDAENNPAFKQLIPYTIVTFGDKMLHYVRGKKSGEGRLVAKGSIGIGGHINDAGGGTAAVSAYNRFTYGESLRREIKEELNIPDGYLYNTVCLLNDDSNSVGRVHLGVVHKVVVFHPGVTFAEPDIITEVSWKTAGELKAVRDSLESWSAICLDGIGEILASRVRQGAFAGFVGCD